jgi:hypothetical protein
MNYLIFVMLVNPIFMKRETIFSFFNQCWKLPDQLGIPGTLSFWDISIGKPRRYNVSKRKLNVAHLQLITLPILQDVFSPKETNH